MQILTFTQDKEVYAIDTKHVKEIIRLDESDVCKSPGESDEYYGLMYLREQPISIFNANVLLNVGSTDVTDDTRIIILEDGSDLYGFTCDAIHEIFHIDESNIEDPTEHNEYIRGVVYCKERKEVIIMLDHRSLFKAFCER